MSIEEPSSLELRISADSHMGEPPDLWERELPSKFRQRALQVEERPFETNHLLRAGCWDPHERLKDLAVDGVSAEVLYPTFGVRAWLIEDQDLQEAHLRVYNDWLIDFCRVAPHRYWGLGMVSLWNVEHAIREMRRFIDAGLRGVDIWIAPPGGMPYSSERYEPFWAAAEELGATVNMHINGLAEPRERDPAGIPIHSINGHKNDAMNSLLHIIASGVLERHPRLKVAVAEAGAGWVPFWLQEADHYTMSRRSTLPMPPSAYFKRQVFCTFISDAIGA
ncbi:MAG: amidohydrolase family protein, partial [Chloroflexi bacterium]|nr:amidohydrolase family protein [Chloroflexota bacterium]